MICGGVTNLPQTPTAGWTAATYELGGMALIDLRTHDVLREVPFQHLVHRWSRRHPQPAEVRRRRR
jgi:hypothetical protein